MFNKNLSALKLKNSILAEKLNSINIDDIKSDIEVYEAESKDIIISYQGLALDDIYDPIRVAKTNWNLNVTKQTSKYDIVVIFGLGLGYLFKRAYVNCESRIVLFEPEINILRYVLEYVDFSDVIADDRVFISCDKNEALSFISEKYLSDDNLFFLYPEAYAQLSTQIMSEFTNDIVEVCNLKKMDVNTIKMLSKKWTLHACDNISNIKTSRPLSWMKNRYAGKTALIAAAGPSLKDNIKIIKGNRDKFIILSVNRAAPILFQNDITPDFILFSDVNSLKDSLDICIDKFKTTNIISDLHSNSQVYSTFENVIIYFSKNDIIAQSVNSLSNNSFDLLETAGTATAQAYYTARLFGIKDIIFAGLDLVFKNNVIYADGKTVTQIENNKVLINASSTYTKALTTVKDIHGIDVRTRDDYALFVRQFEDIFSADKGVNVYNVSDFGAFINGMKYVSLNELVNKLSKTDVDINADILNFRTETEKDWGDLYSTILKFMKVEKINLKSIYDKTIVLLDKEREVLKKITDSSDNNLANEEFADISSEFSNLLPEIIKDALLSQYFQSEFLNFINFSNDATNIGIEAFINLKNFEIQLLSSLVEFSADRIRFLEEKFN